MKLTAAIPILLRDPILRWSALLIAGIGVFWLSGLDARIALLVADLDSQWAWWLRNWSTYPALVVSVLALGFLFVPPLRKRWHIGRHMAVVWLFALIVGGGLINQVVVKELMDRPRPREAVLVEPAKQPAAAEIAGNSFPSGHAVIGFIFMVPGLVLWRRQRKLAVVFIAGGLAAGAGVGFGRMALGAHYVSDILGSLLFTAIPAALMARWWPQERDLPTWFSGGFMALALGSLIGFNDFRLTLFWTPEEAAVERLQLNLPCNSVEVGRGQDLAVRVQITAYGAPISNLQLDYAAGMLRLTRWRGAFHSIDCAVQVALPPNVTLALDDEAELLSNGLPPTVTGPLNGWLTVRYPAQ